MLNVNRSTYYKHFSSAESARAKEDRQIKSYILTLHGRYKKRLGVNKLTLLLQREYGLKIGQTRVRRLFKAMNLPQIFSRKVPNKSVKSTSGDFHNLLKRKFNPDEPNKIWASDITYLKVGSKWYYLCVVIDLFSRKVIAWLLSDKPDAKLVIDTFNRGTQYTSAAFRKFLDALNVVQSFSAKYSTFADLQISLFEYIDGFYNPTRPHSAIDFLSPNDFESKFFSSL